MRGPVSCPHSVAAAVAAGDSMLERLAHFVPDVCRHVVHLRLRTCQLHFDGFELLKTALLSNYDRMFFKSMVNESVPLL